VLGFIREPEFSAPQISFLIHPKKWRIIISISRMATFSLRGLAYLYASSHDRPRALFRTLDVDFTRVCSKKEM